MQSPKDAFKHIAQKIKIPTEEARKGKTRSGVQKTKRPLAVNITINKNDTPPQTQTSGKEIVNPFNEMSKISKLYLLQLFRNFHIPWLILRVF